MRGSLSKPRTTTGNRRGGLLDGASTIAFERLPLEFPIAEKFDLRGPSPQQVLSPGSIAAAFREAP